MSIADHQNVSAQTQTVRLVLQFEFLSNGYPVKKEVILELEPSLEDDHMLSSNPVRAINRTTAAILQLLAGTGGGTEASLEPPSTHDIKLRLKGFTSREMEVFAHLMTGATNAEVAAKLSVSQNTIKFHVKNILRKLDVKNRVELALKFSQT